MVNRREFLKGGLASLGFMALDGLPVFAAPSDWKPNRKPDLVFGELADTLRLSQRGARLPQHGAVQARLCRLPARRRGVCEFRALKTEEPTMRHERFHV